MISSTTLDFEPIKNVLKFTGDFTYKAIRSTQVRVSCKEGGYSAPGALEYYNTSSYKSDWRYNTDYISSNIVGTYTPKLGDNHDLNIVAGWNLEKTNYRRLYLSRNELLYPSMPSFELMSSDEYKVEDDGYDKSMVEIASDVVVGKDTTEKISEAVEDVKGLKNKAGEAVDAVNSAMGDINSKWSGMSNFFRGIFGGNGLEMFGNFFKNLGKGNVSGLSLAGLVTAAFLTFGRFGWLGKIAGAMLGMMLIGNNSNIKNIVSGDGGQGKNVSEAETTTRSGGMKR